MVIDNATGNYRFLKGIRPYSSAVVAAPGYEIVHVTLGAPLAFESGFHLMARHLAGVGRPLQALCAVELRSPCPFSFEGFAEFNTRYRRTLADAEILVEDLLQGMDDLNPVARTNVAPEIVPPVEPSLYAFSYTVPCPGSEVRPTFVVAGAGELLEGRLDPEAIVRPNEVSMDALCEKVAYVLQCMTARLQGLGMSWDQVGVVNIYTVHDIFPLLPEIVFERLGPTGRHGVCWHYARPPIVGLEYEMDVRSVRTELHL